MIKDILTRALSPIWLLFILALAGFLVGYGIGGPEVGRVLMYLLAIAFFIITGLYAAKTGVPPMASSSQDQKAMMQALHTHLAEGPSGPIYELGAGFGDIAIALAKEFPAREVHAYELSPFPYFYMKLRAKLAGLDNLHLHWADFFKVSLAEAGVIICYLYPEVMQKLEPKLKADLKADTLVIANSFTFADQKPAEVIETGKSARHRVYVYRGLAQETRSPEQAA